MRLAGSCASDKNDIALAGDEAASGQIAHQSFVDGRAVEVKIIDVLGQREFGEPLLPDENFSADRSPVSTASAMRTAYCEALALEPNSARTAPVETQGGAVHSPPESVYGRRRLVTARSVERRITEGAYRPELFWVA